MTPTIGYTLVGDGPSDRVLTHVADWVLRRSFGHALLEEPAFLPRAHQPIPQAVDLARQRFGRNVIIVHRDAERARWETRVREIPHDAGVVRLIPVRMTETWLLGDEAAIRSAAGHPSGRHALGLPPWPKVETLPDPKKALQEALVAAAGSPRGRRLKRLRRDRARLTHLVADYTEDWAHLRSLEAFRHFQAELVSAIAADADLPPTPSGSGR